MSATSSDSESSCGWTFINNEGSDIETLTSEHGESSTGLVADDNHALLEDLEEQAKLLQLQVLCSRDEVLPASEITCVSLEETKFSPEIEDEKSPENSICIGTTSDDSDIVTLDSPKVEEIGTQEKAFTVDEEAEESEDLNLGSSSSSQYTFSQPENVFPCLHTTDESSNDEVSDSSCLTPKRRRAKRKAVSGFEPEARAPIEVVQLQKAPSSKFSSLNRCIILALVIAVSMGFGHFYGTLQIQERQKYVEKIHEDELNDMKDDLYQCQKEQETSVCQKLEGGVLVSCLEISEVEFHKKSLAAENMHLKESLDKEEKALYSLQEELRKLREEIRNVEEKGTGTELVLAENQLLKEHLEEEKLRIHTVLGQKETLLSEAQLLKSELDKEKRNTKALREELKEFSSTQSSSNTENMLQGEQEIENMHERLKELEKKLNFEQQRSDLWERLYIEARENGERQETRDSGERKENGKTKKKAKDSFFGSVKDTFDAMKNSTKEFVRHHKEKIKLAKQAVKEKLKKFSDSVKSTFRHLKDSTQNIFDRNRNKRKSESRRGEHTKAKTVFGEFQNPHHPDHSKKTAKNAETTQAQFKDSREQKRANFEKTNSRKYSHGHEFHEHQQSQHQRCSGVLECAHKESISLFNKVLDPVKAEEFTHLMYSYLQQEVDEFHHWNELMKFINRFFLDGVFIHDRMLFTDFVNDVEHYLEDLKEYQTPDDRVFEDLEEFVYRHYFGDSYSTTYGFSQTETRPPSRNADGPKRLLKPHQRPHHKREGKWHKDGRTNGRHMANLEIELGPLPFDPKY